MTIAVPFVVLLIIFLVLILQNKSKMDLTTLLIGVAALAIFIVPVLMIQVANRRRDKRRIKAFKQLAAQNGLTLTKYDTWGESCIGVDEEKKKVYFSTGSNGQASSTLVNLSDVQTCSVSSDGKSLKTKEYNSALTERVSLDFWNGNGKQPEKSFLFFDKSIDSTLTDELLLAQKWEKIISDIIRG